MSEEVILGLGSNMGEREAQLRKAIGEISFLADKTISKSHIYETEPWGFESTDKFLNMALMIMTSLPPDELLGRVLEIETKLGRIRQKDRYSSRVIDIDILLYGKKVISKPNLVIPHPLIQERRFVLVPLLELLPDGIHPVLHRTFSSLLEECMDKGEVKLFG